MYYEYWGLKKSPFDNVPDPSMYVESHASVENTIAETIFAIEEGNEAVAVIVGDVGLGKTLSLRLVLDSLDQKKYCIAFVTNPDMSFVQLLREIIGQLTGSPCELKNRIDLLEVFNKLLFETSDQGKKILIMIDEANALQPANLESLRLLTNMQDDQKNLLTLVLAGQMELARRLEHPSRANLFQRIGTYNRLEKIGDAGLVKDYVETRIKLAGGTRRIFTEDAFPVLWELSEYGTPRLINKICKLCLKAGETNRFEMVHAEIVRQIGERFQKLTGPALQKRRPRIRPAPEQPLRMQKPLPREPEPLGQESAPCAAFLEPGSEELLDDAPESAEWPDVEAEDLALGAPVDSEGPVVEDGAPAAGTTAVQASWLPPSEHDWLLFSRPPAAQTPPAAPQADVVPEAAAPAPAVADEVAADAATPQHSPSELRNENAGWRRRSSDTLRHEADSKEPVSDTDEIMEEARIGKYRIKIGIPVQLVRQAQSSSRENRLKLAGGLAAQTLQKYPQLTFSTSADPVAVWSEIRNVILNTLEGTEEQASR